MQGRGEEERAARVQARGAPETLAAGSESHAADYQLPGATACGGGGAAPAPAAEEEEDLADEFEGVALVWVVEEGARDASPTTSGTIEESLAAEPACALGEVGAWDVAVTGTSATSTSEEEAVAPKSEEVVRSCTSCHKATSSSARAAPASASAAEEIIPTWPAASAANPSWCCSEASPASPAAQEDLSSSSRTDGETEGAASALTTPTRARPSAGPSACAAA